MSFPIKILRVGDPEWRADGPVAMAGAPNAKEMVPVTVEVGTGTGKRVPTVLTVDVPAPYSRANLLTAVKAAVSKYPDANPDDGVTVEVV